MLCLRRSASIKKNGFTLIELAFVLLIVSLLMGVGLTYLTGKANQEKYDITLKRMEKIEEALWQYRRAYKRLPCPADRTNDIASSDFNLHAVALGSPGACTANYTDGSNLMDGGTIPVWDINLPTEYMYDGWGRKFSYAVTRKLTATNAFTTYPINSVSASEIIIRDGNASGPTYGNDKTPTFKAAYVLISHGKNGHGAYNRNGQRVKSPTTNSVWELQNCKCNSAGVPTIPSNTIFVQSEPNTNTASNYSNYFDDIVHFKTRFQVYSPAPSGPNAETPPVTSFTGGS